MTKPDTKASIGLAFAPCQVTADSLNNFKFVCVLQFETGSKGPYLKFNVCSSNAGTWKSQNICHHGGDISRKAVICIKGILHWLTSSSKILAFNVQDEKSSVISAPLAYLPADDEPLYAWCIGEPDDKLHYVMVSNYGLDVWSLEDYVESKWNLRSSESLEMIIEENRLPRRQYYMRPMNCLAFKDGYVLMVNKVDEVYARFLVGFSQAYGLCKMRV